MAAKRFLPLLLALAAVTAFREESAAVADHDDPTDPCEAHGGACAACVEDSRCGWCHTLGACMAGGLDGPKLRKCPLESWSFAYCKGEPCSSYSRCSSCIGDVYCGWCATDRAADLPGGQGCLEGSAKGPTAGECSGQWVFSPVTAGLTSAKAAKMDIAHLGILREVCTDAGFGTLAGASEPGIAAAAAAASPAPTRAPVVLSVSPSSGPVFGGTVLTVAGAFFGQTSDAVKVLVGGIECDDVSLKSASVLTCSSPARPAWMPLEHLALEVQVDGASSNQTRALDAEHAEGPASRYSMVVGADGEPHTPSNAQFSYLPLQIMGVSPREASTRGGEVIAVRGVHFGTPARHPTLRVGEVDCLETTFVTSTELRCVVPPGTGRSAPVVAMLGDYASGSHSEATVSYEEPVLISIEPTHGPSAGNSTLVVRGRNFGPAAAQPTLLIGGVPCASTLRVSHQELSCLTQPGLGAGHQVAVEVQSTVPTFRGERGPRRSRQAHIRFDYDPPHVHSVLPHHGPARGGNLVVISGDNLAAAAPAGAEEAAAAEKRVGLSMASLRAMLSGGDYDGALDQMLGVMSWRLPQHPAYPSGRPEGFNHSSPSPRQDPEGLWQEAETNEFCLTCRSTGCANATCASTCPALCDSFGSAPAAGVAFGDTQDTQLLALLELNARVGLHGNGTGELGNATAGSVEGMGDNMTASLIREVLANASAALEASEAAASEAAGSQGPSPACGQGALDRTPHGGACIRVTIGGKPCTEVAIVSSSQLVCKAPEGVGAHQSVVVLAGNQASQRTPNATYWYDRPLVMGVDEPTGPTVGGAVVLVRGRNFGARNYEPLVRIGEQLCTYSAWIDDGRVECGLPQGLGANLSVTVEVAGQASVPNEVRFRYEEPVVERVMPSHGPTTGGFWIDIFGRNFGSLGHTPHLNVNSTPCLNMTWESDRQVRCLVQRGKGGNLSVNVAAGNQLNHPNTLFSYDGPEVDDVQPGTCDTPGGCQLKIRGRNFGEHPDSTLHVHVGGRLCKELAWISGGELECNVASGVGVDLDVQVQLAGLVSVPNAFFSYKPPFVEAATPARSHPDGGQVVVVRGRNFGLEDAGAVVRVGDTPCTSTTWHNDTHLLCEAPPGTGWNLELRVVVAGAASETFVRFDYDLPRVAFLEPEHGPTEGMYNVTLYGDNFAGVVRALFGNASYAYEFMSCHNRNVRELVCTVPPGRGNDHEVRLAVGGRLLEQRHEHGRNLLVSTELRQNEQGVVDVRTRAVPRALMDRLMEEVAEARKRGKLDRLSLRALDADSPDRMEIQLLPLDSSPAPKFSFDVPIIEDISPPVGAVVGGTNITITGRNFGPAGSSPKVYIDVLRSRDVLFDNQTHRGLTECHNVKWISQRELKCEAPSGVSHHRAVVVELDAQRSARSRSFKYERPIVSALSPDHGPPAGGYDVALAGKNFGTAATRIRVRVGARWASNVTFVNNTLLMVHVPPGHSSHRGVVVDVEDQESEPVRLFHYDPPEVHSVSPNHERVHGGGWITITGRNFGGRHNTERPAATINGLPCQETRWVDRTHLRCAVPQGMGRALSVIVHYGNQHSLGNKLFSYTDMDCDMGEWTEWTECSRPCSGKGSGKGHDYEGPGTQSRARVLVQARENFGKDCPHGNETRVCNTQACPVHCVVGDWTPWSGCSKPCHGLGSEMGHAHVGPGELVRTRQVQRPAEHGGVPCPPLREERKCNTWHCPVNCALGAWTGWGACSQRCQGLGEVAGHSFKGVGTQKRTRPVTREPRFGGTPCGRVEEERLCNTDICPIDCKVGPWSDWGACSKACGVGKSFRERKVLRAANYGGRECTDALTEMRVCNTHTCPANCEVSDWTSWSHCSKSGFGGERFRTRTVVTHPAHGGSRCPPLKEVQHCNTGPHGENVWRTLEVSFADASRPALHPGNNTEPVRQLLVSPGRAISFLKFHTHHGGVDYRLRLYVSRWDSSVSHLEARTVVESWDRVSVSWESQPRLGDSICTLWRKPQQGEQFSAGIVWCDITGWLRGKPLYQNMSLAVVAHGHGQVELAGRHTGTFSDPHILVNRGNDAKFGAFIYPTQDGSVNEGSLASKRMALGWTQYIYVRNRPNSATHRGTGLFTFRVPTGIPAHSPRRAVFRLFAKQYAHQYYSTNLWLHVLAAGAWDEKSAVWANRPSTGREICRITGFAQLSIHGYTDVECDVTSAADWKPGTTVHLALASVSHSQTYAVFFAEEANNFHLRPHVMLTYA